MPCLTETFRLKDETTSSLLPDVIVASRPLPPGATSLNDPTMVIEVLSDGTGRRDREDKWAVYQLLPSLRHDALVTRDKPHVEIFDRQGDVWGGFRIVDGLAASLDLPALGVSIPLAEVYADVLV